MKTETEKRITTKRQKIALVLVILAVAVDSIGWCIAPWFIPDVTISHLEQGTIDYWKSIGYPNITVTLSISFTAQASLSVNNPVHVRVVVLNDSTQGNFLSYFNRMSFTDAFSVDALNYKGDIPPYTEFYFHQNATGSIVAEGDFKWMNQGPSWSFLMPTGKSVQVNYPDVERGAPSAIVAPLSDTLTIDNAIVTYRLTFVLIGFSILTTQPLWEAVFKIRSDQQQTQAKQLGLWHQYYQQAKQERPNIESV
jgi:hypothetical protein